MTITRAVEKNQFMDILDASSIRSTHDLGGVILHDADHPEMGGITLMSSVNEEFAVVRSA